MSAKKKFYPLQFFRFLVQIVFFVFLPGLYASAFTGIKLLYQGLLNGTLDFPSDWLILIEVIAVVPATVLLGRFFCGWMCAFGSVGDWLYVLSRKIFRVNFKISEKTDRILKNMKYIYLLILAIFVWNADWYFLKSANPWDAFGYIFSIKTLPDIKGALEYFALGCALLLIILIMSMVIQRFFCRYLCPLGAVFAVISKFRLIRIRKAKDKCGSCKSCTSSCPMGIPLYKYDEVSTGECIQCMRCTDACFRQNAKPELRGKSVNPSIISLAAIGSMLILYLTGNHLSFNSSDSISTTETVSETSVPQTTEESSTGIYSDGVYEGSGIGYRGSTTTLSVTVAHGFITAISVVSYGDDGPYFSRALNPIVNDIITTQSTDVDAVSGATFSSDGIISAVADALAGASD